MSSKIHPIYTHMSNVLISLKCDLYKTTYDLNSQSYLYLNTILSHFVKYPHELLSSLHEQKLFVVKKLFGNCKKKERLVSGKY